MGEWKSILLATLVMPYLNQLKDWVTFSNILKLFAYSYRINSHSESYHLAQKAVSKHVKKTRRWREVTLKSHSTSAFLFDEVEDETQMMPDTGVYWFRFEGTWVRARVETKTPDSASSQQDSHESITFYFVSRDSQPVIDFREYLTSLEEEERKEKTGIWVPRWSYWSLVNLRRRRPESTLFYPGDLHLDLLEDLKRFLNSQERYFSKGRVHKRCYLLYGPPGNGKTTLLTWLASQLGKDLCMISGDMEGDKFLQLVSSMPKDSILLFEDVDTIFDSAESREDDRVDDESSSPPAPRKKKLNADNKVGLSVLLNFLDGLYSKDGQIVFMTTNYPNKLDGALTRKGRVDRHVKLPHPDDDSIARFFNFYYPDADPRPLIKAYRDKGELAPVGAFQELFDTTDDPSDLVSNMDTLYQPRGESDSERDQDTFDG